MSGREVARRRGDMRATTLMELAEMELADIIASANESGFSAREVLDALSAAIDSHRKALAEDPDPADDPAPMRGAETVPAPRSFGPSASLGRREAQWQAILSEAPQCVSGASGRN